MYVCMYMYMYMYIHGFESHVKLTLYLELVRLLTISCLLHHPCVRLTSLVNKEIHFAFGCQRVGNFGPLSREEPHSPDVHYNVFLSVYQLSTGKVTGSPLGFDQGIIRYVSSILTYWTILSKKSVFSVNTRFLFRFFKSVSLLD